jgi:serine phosphatase RsbU (regulator of sigma subunit)/PAS domain-containing protein
VTGARGPGRHDVRARVLLAAVVGALGIAAITFAASQVSSLSDRPGGALMASLILVIAVTLIGGEWIGYAVVLAALVTSAYYLTRPLHSLHVGTVGVRILYIGFVVTGIAIAALVARLAVARDEAERTRRRTDRLQHLTASLSRARTAAAVYEVVLMEGREALGANAGLIATPSDDGSSIELSATLGFTPAEQEGWQRFPTSVRTPIGDAVLTGQAVFLDEGELAKRYPPMRTSSAPTASVPLRADGPVLGALGFRFERGHRFSESERAFATVLAEHCAHALERARLYDAERRSREALAVLASIGEHLARSLEADSALRTLAELAVPAVADQCVVDLVRGDRIERRALVHADPALQEAARTLEQFAPDIASTTPVAVAIREGKTQLVPVTEDLPDSAYRSEAHRVAVRKMQLRSMLTAPLIVRGRTLGALTFGWRRERGFDQEDIELSEQLARRVALAIDNGALYQEAHGERERLSALVRQLPLGVLIAEAPSGREVLANARAEEILGRTRSTEVDAPHMATVRAALAGESVSDSELVLRRADGSLGVVSISAEPVRDADGSIVAAVATLFDLTDYRRREEALSFLAEASQALTRSLDFTATLADLVRLAVPRLADWCSIDLLEHGRIRNVEVANVDAAAAERLRAELQQRPADMDGTTGAAAAIRSGRAELVTEIRATLLDGKAGNADLVRTLNDLGIEPVSSITAPLRAHGRTLGALTLVAAESGRRFSESDLAVASDLARRAALAIDNARLYEAQHEIAHTLQQSLLPGTLVQPPGMEIAARYRPAGIGAEVGGDFYDAWPLADGFALAIGDVAGKGPAAAALTALTRHAMRVASRYESSPSCVLKVANEAILGHDKASEFCTTALAFLRPSDDGYTLTTACAGHAPPLVLRGRSEEVEEAGICGTLLGVDLRAEFHDYTTKLEGGDLLAFWTDGVTERRNSGELFGEQRLAALIERLAGKSAETIVQQIDEAVVAFAPGLPDDDVAILAARVTTATPVAGRGTDVEHAAGASRD